MVFFPAGSVSVWHVTQEVRKLAVCRHSMPRPLGFAVRVWNKFAAILYGSPEDGDALDSGPEVRASRARRRPPKIDPCYPHYGRASARR